MANHSNSEQMKVTERILGFRVDRATAQVPQTAAAAIFTIAGGRVAMTAILGELTVGTDATASNMSLEATPTVGTLAAICAATASASMEIGTLISIDGLAATALKIVNAGGVSLQQYPVILNTGTLNLRMSGSNVAGYAKWSLWYRPIDDGATVTAA